MKDVLLKNQWNKRQWFIERPVKPETLKMLKENGYKQPAYFLDRQLPDADPENIDFDVEHKYYWIFSQHKVVSTSPDLGCPTIEGNFEQMLSEFGKKENEDIE